VSSHASKVERIAAQLRAHTGSRPVSLRKKAVSHQVPKSGDLRHKDDKIDVSDLTEILSIDPAARTCTAESGVTFVDLVTATLAHDLVPIVVPELETITIGGAVSGCSIESMSFVHGGFHDTCLEYEVITATGEILRCTPDNEHSLVFQMIHGSFGTLGVLATLTFKLVPAKPFVHLVYERHTTLAAFQHSIAQHARDRDIDFMDGIIHSPSLWVLCTGRFVERAPYTTRYDWVKVYYQSTATRSEDYLDTKHYFFRYNRGVTNVRPRSFVGRLLFGKFLQSSQWLRIAEKVHFLLPKERPTVTLDVFVPFSKTPEFMDWWVKTCNFFPLWCVPYRRVHDYEWLPDTYWRALGDDMFLDIAVYGMRQPPGRNYHREIEVKLRELGGIKTLIAHNYYGEEEFWQIFNKPNYDAAKRVTDPNNLFRDLYTKTCKAAMGRT
jgi:FAD/FMN-containing dehydrogenase